MKEYNMNVWEKLSEQGLVEGEKPEMVVRTPWYIKILLSISGWLGSLFLVVFIGGIIGLVLNDNIEDFPLLLTIVGGGIIFFTYNMFQEQRGDFFEHFLLGLSLAGQGLVIVSVFFILTRNSTFFSMFDKDVLLPIYLFSALFQAFLMWVMPNYIHRVMSSFFMVVALSGFFIIINEPFIINTLLTFVVTWLWLNEFTVRNHARVEAITYGLTAALVFLIYSLFSFSYYIYESINFENKIYFSLYIVELSTFAIFVYVIWNLFVKGKKLNSKRGFLLLITLLVFAYLSIKIGGLIFALILILIGFAHKHNLLTALGIFSAFAFLSTYYYYTGETLMDKSILLALMGVGIFLGRFMMKIVLEKEVSDV